MELVIVTGMSGAGKSKVIDALEDIGFFCVDNVPPQMLGKFAQLGQTNGGSAGRMALVVDSRGREMFGDFSSALDALEKDGISFRILFLDADDGVLLRRYQEGRRRHPLLDGNTITVERAIRLERTLLAVPRERADYVLDTSQLSPAQLKEQIVGIFLAGVGQSMVVRCLSFGFKNGLPKEADLVFDVRGLPNPFYIPALKAYTGLDPAVRDYVMKWPQSQALLAKLFDLVDFLLPLSRQEGKSQLVIAMGCTGGQHRSVVFAQAMGEHLLAQGLPVVIAHRDQFKAPGARR